jgi:hypothetical protein
MSYKAEPTDRKHEGATELPGALAGTNFRLVDNEALRPASYPNVISTQQALETMFDKNMPDGRKPDFHFAGVCP